MYSGSSIQTTTADAQLSCHRLGVIVIGLILGCAVLLSEIFARLASLEIWVMDCSYNVYLK